MIQFDVSSDSTCDLYKEYREERRIWFAPLTFTLDKNGKQEEGLDEFSCYQDYIDFYKKVEDGAFPRTSMLNYEAHLEHFRKMAAAGVKDVLHFSISSGLARTVTVAKQAAEEIKKEYPEFNLYSVDPLTATIGQGMLVSLACDCRDKGMSAQETYDYLMDVRLRIQHCIIPNDLFYLKKGGRVSAVSAVFGTAHFRRGHDERIAPVFFFDGFHAGNKDFVHLFSVGNFHGKGNRFARQVHGVFKADMFPEGNFPARRVLPHRPAAFFKLYRLGRVGHF